MPKINRTENARAIAIAATRDVESNTGIVEYAIVAFAGLAVALLLVADGVLPYSMQTLLR